MKNDYIKKYNIIFVYISLKKFYRMLEKINKIYMQKILCVNFFMLVKIFIKV